MSATAFGIAEVVWVLQKEEGLRRKSDHDDLGGVAYWGMGRKSIYSFMVMRNCFPPGVALVLLYEDSTILTSFVCDSLYGNAFA